MSKEDANTTATAKPVNRQRGIFGVFSRRRSGSLDDSSDSEDVEEKKMETLTLKDSKEEETKTVSIFQLFRFHTKYEIFVNFVGLFAASCSGAAQPLMSLIFGNLTQTFVDYELALSQSNAADISAARAKFLHDTSLDSCYLVLLGGVLAISSWTYMFIWNYTGEKSSKRIRELYFEAVLRQEIAYFDKVGAGEVTNHIETDTHLVQQGISEKCPLVVNNFACFVTGFVLAYARSWRLALVMTSVVPCMSITGAVMTTLVTRLQKSSLNHMSEGSTIAEEVISSVRTAHAFGTQHVLSALFETPMKLAHKFELKSATVNGICISIFLFIIYCLYSLAFYYGTTLVIDGIGGVGVIMNVIFAILLGSFNLGQVAAEMQPIMVGQAAAAKLFATIDRVPEIDSQSQEGMKPSSVEGEIRLEDVSFDYPSRPDVPILRNLSLQFPAGKNVALVGASGSGKSTVVQLVERFYDPLGGRVTLDGNDLRDLNIKWLRSQISLVSQEPILFRTTIAGNVEHGLVGTIHEHASGKEKLRLIKEACVKANADSFISRLPNGYDTLVGERGFLLSGGQKQRIAIARAIVSDPKILLLDEATSALDTQSEGVVQDALDKAAAGRTTITIAHRLSTIKGADIIYVMGGGRVLEQGTHEDLLLNSEGAYSKLVIAQKVRDGTKELDFGDSKKSDTELSEIETFEDVDGYLLKEKDIERSHSVADDHTSRRHSINRSSLDLAKDKGDEQSEGGIFRLFFRILDLDRSLIRQYIFGMLFAICQGMVYPGYGIVMSKAITAFSTTDYAMLRFEGDRNALWFFVISVCSMIVIGGEHLMLGRAAANVVQLLRCVQFKAILRQDIRFFDEDSNSTGALVSKISDNPQKINGLLGTTLGTICQGVSTLITGFIIGLIFGWQLALVAMACEPFIVTVGYIRLQSIVVKDRRNKKAHEESAQFACEIAAAIRTVASLTRESNCLLSYRETLEEPLRRSISNAIWSNLLYAFAQSSIFFATALAFWFGATEISNGKVSTTAFFIVIFSVIFGASEAGAIWQYAPDISSAGSAARDMNKLLNSVPEIDAQSSEGLTPANVRGEVRLQNVHFRYPTRPGVKVLRGLDLQIDPGTYVALVGASGCGKSTVIQLMERFYDPISGNVLLDGQDISQLNVQEYRKNIALVSQEPTLYAGSIKFNILLGATKPASEVTQEELETVCRAANILEFITSLPNGFDTEVGGKGSQLSGGQKQRIAIARALIRNPKVLLLDEATSALDSNSEHVVQQALDQAAKGRTTIAIAHRLSTIQNADRIYFIKDGVVSECGTHDELLALRGGYYEYVQLQALSKSK